MINSVLFLSSAVVHVSSSLVRGSLTEECQLKRSSNLYHVGFVLGRPMGHPHLHISFFTATSIFALKEVQLQKEANIRSTSMPDSGKCGPLLLLYPPTCLPTNSHSLCFPLQAGQLSVWWIPSSKPSFKPQTKAPAGSGWRDATSLTGQPPSAILPACCLLTCLSHTPLPTCPLPPTQTPNHWPGLSTQPLACLLGANKALTTTLLDVSVSVLVVAGGQNGHPSFPH